MENPICIMMGLVVPQFRSIQIAMNKWMFPKMVAPKNMHFNTKKLSNFSGVSLF